MKKALIILHQKRSRPGDVGNKLIKRGYELDIRRPSIGDKLPLTMDNHDLAIVFGGPMSINDESLDFIKYEINWINNVIKSGKPFLGICLGAQMLAKCLGGCVECCADKSSEIGFFNISPIGEGADLFKYQKFFYQWHNEGIMKLNSCKILATGDKFSIQAFQYKNAYGFQFHPEVNFYLHIRWLILVFIFSREKFKVKGFQSIFNQIIYRFLHNKRVSTWLDTFLDDYLLKFNKV